ncbi:hypothetical protein [Bacteroides pyogenes]|uniref:hypothetical protein n=1 Tax=Bacteroides pyogenes TaxID=310300 RepID=UPI003F9FBB24
MIKALFDLSLWSKKFGYQFVGIMQLASYLIPGAPIALFCTHLIRIRLSAFDAKLFLTFLLSQSEVPLLALFPMQGKINRKRARAVIKDIASGNVVTFSVLFSQYNKETVTHTQKQTSPIHAGTKHHPVEAVFTCIQQAFETLTICSKNANPVDTEKA